VPAPMEAPPITTALHMEYLRVHPLRYAEDTADEVTVPAGWRSDEDEAKVADHLRALGYLE